MKSTQGAKKGKEGSLKKGRLAYLVPVILAKDLGRGASLDASTIDEDVDFAVHLFQGLGEHGLD